MASRNQKELYCFIVDDNGKFRTAKQQNDGSYSMFKNAQPMPIKYQPTNIGKIPFEFATNSKYMSLARSVTDPIEFIKDGAAIHRDLYYNGKGTQQRAFLIVIEWDGSQTPARYTLSYRGRFDYNRKIEDSKSGTFTVPCVDDSAWGVLQNQDSVVHAIECNATNPKAIKVLVDGVTLLNRATYQTVQSPITDYNADNIHIVPFVLVNQSGDSAGIVLKNQTLSSYGVAFWYTDAPTWFFSTAYILNNVNISGSMKFIPTSNNPRLGGLKIYFITSTGQQHLIFNQPTGGTLVAGNIYTVTFDFNINLAAAENIFFVAELNDNAANLFTITPIVTDITISTKTTTEPQIVYGLRPLDFAQELVNKATFGRYSINSDFFTVNNKDIITSGDAIRSIDNAKIYANFEDFFKHFNCQNFMALRNILGQIWMEKAIQVYAQGITLLDIGEVIDCKPIPASEHNCNSIIVGSKDQDYRHPSGRLEFNAEDTFSAPMYDVDKKLELVSPWRTDSLGIIFLILDYQGQSTQDNSGDKDVFVMKITDEQATAVNDVETFENITVDGAVLEPIIKHPLTNDVINFDKPFLSGICIPLSTVNVYVDTVLDGTTTANAQGNWSYNIATSLSSYDAGIATGEHTIETTYTDLSGATDSILVVIDTTVSTLTKITYPEQGDSYYNNLPLIKGIAQNGTNIDVFLDGSLIGSVVADNSCRWEFKVTVPFSNTAHILDVGAGTSVNFNTDSRVAYPLITYIGSELDGFLIVNNMPEVRGVAISGTIVTLWLNYITYASIGTATADANGNWSFQLIPVSYNDPISGIPVVVVPIRNGISVVSTSLVNHTVGVNVSGYKLSRPLYSSITGVVDNTVFNTEYSPKRMLQNWFPWLASIFKKQPFDKLIFQKSSKNGNLATILNGVSTIENKDVVISSLGTPLALMEYLELKVIANTTFAQTLYNFSQGGIIRLLFRGTQLFALPIGGMKIPNIKSDIQDWKLLLSPQTTFASLLNLYKNGLIIQLMQNSIYHSDYNTLHLVTYDFTELPQFNNKTIYEDWFNNRNQAWILNPDYIQMLQKTEVFRDQIIANGVTPSELRKYRCLDGSFVRAFAYNAVAPAPISLPEIVFEAIIDNTLDDDGQYFYVLFVDETPVAISERIDIKVKHEGSILIDATSSINQVGAFFSTGFKSLFRCEGLVKKLQPNINTIVAEEESGDTELLYSQNAREREIRFGTAYGLPDYLYLKIAMALQLDILQIEGVYYVLKDGEKINPSEDVEGHPLYYYNVKMTLKENAKGNMLPGSDGADLAGVILVVDALAFGLPAGSLINIELPNE